MSKDITGQLKKAFGTTDEDVLEKLATFCDIFNVSAVDLFVSWETYIVTKVELDLDLTLPNLDRFQEYMQSNLANSSLLTSRNRDPLPPNASGSARKRPMFRGDSQATSSPVSQQKAPFLSPSHKKPRVFASLPASGYETAADHIPSSPLKQQLQSAPVQESHVIVETLNPHLDGLPGLDTDQEKPYTLASNFDASKYRFRTMSMKLLESADVLDDQIDTMAQLYQESLKSDQEKEDDIKFGNPCLSSQFDIYCCGRIVPDSPSHNAGTALNSTSLYLETSRMSGIGQRIPLDLGLVAGYSLFPGQIVVLKGRNPTGKKFLVQEIMPLPELAAPVLSHDELSEYQATNKGQGLKILMACGPFSNMHTLEFTRLANLVEHINTQSKPHMVILNGPFIDINNSQVSEGDFDFGDMPLPPRNLDEVFQKLVSPILNKIDAKIQVILCPSVRDTCVKHCLYPQDAFDRKKFGLSKHIKVFPNPASFSVNEVVVGNSNLDIFKDLRDVYDEASTCGVSSNRFERVVGHMFDQRRFYPTFPGAVMQNRNPVSESLQVAALLDGIAGEDVASMGVGGSMLEVPYMGLTEFAGTMPDVLLVPSEMKFFAKAIRGVVVVNPGYFIRANRDPGREEGTYALLSVQPLNLTAEDCNVQKVDNCDQLYYHNLAQRCRVDILRS